MRSAIFASLLGWVSSLTINAATGSYDLLLGGVGGTGLRGSNEVPGNSSAATGFDAPDYGSGAQPGTYYGYGLVGEYIVFRFGWGSLAGGTDLSGDVTEVSLWGAATQTQTSANRIATFSLATSTAGGRSGTVNQTLMFYGAGVDGLGGYNHVDFRNELLAGHFYINIFTSDPLNPSYATGGEIRAQLLSTVPEPIHGTLVGALALGAFAWWRRGSPRKD